MSVPLIQPSFAAGELSPSLYGRVDLGKWHVGLSTARNGFISYRGGFFSRAGTAFTGFSKQTGRGFPPRLIDFQFNINQGLVLEFGHLYMRVIQDGAFVTETATAITGVTQAAPGVVHDTVHGYVSGDWVFIAGILGMTQLNGQIYTVVRIDADHFSLTDVYGNAIDTTAFDAYVSGGTAARLYTLTTTYQEQDLIWLKFTQSADVMSLCCWNQPSGTSYPPRELKRLANNSWTITDFSTASTVAAPTNASGSTSSAGTTDYQYAITAVGSDSTESVASNIADIPSSVNISSTLGSISLAWSPSADAAYYHVYKAPPAFGATVPVGSLFGYAGLCYGATFVDSNITPDFNQVPPLHKNPFAPGQIRGLTITSGGAGIGALSFSVTTSTGSGFDGSAVVEGGVLVAFIVTNHGSGYVPADTITFTAGGFPHATGSIDFSGSGNPSPGDTITLNGVVWTFVAGAPAVDETQIQIDLATTMAQLAGDLTASVDPALTVASYAATATALGITYNVGGTAGNAYTLAASVATPSGAHLTGGSGTQPTATLILGAQSGTYPSVPAYFQQRRVYGGSPNQPDTYWMSQSGLFTNFDSRVPTIDSDAIVGTPWSLQVDGIQYMVSMPGGLVVLTGSSAWQVAGAGGSALAPQPITPASQQAQPQAYNGCSPTVPPIKINADINYVQAKGSIVRDLSYNYWINIYTGTDITYLSSHLFTGFQVFQWAWAEEPYKVIWAVRTDGILLSLTYMKEQEVMSWTRHDTRGLFRSVCSVTEPPVDAVYFCVERFTPVSVAAQQNAYMIERMDNRIWAQVEESWCVDAGLRLPQSSPNATLRVSTSIGNGIIDGIAGLVGGNGYSAGTTITIADPTGSGAVLTPTIVGGVVTAATILSGGLFYTNPKLSFNDPSALGSGAAATVTLDNSAQFSASPGVFNAGMIGSVIRVGGGVATVTGYTSASIVTANITTPITNNLPDTPAVPGIPLPATPGNWTLTAPVTRISGLNHLIGLPVTGLADGAVISPRTVAVDGSITLDAPASSVTVGLGFQAQAQSLYVDGGSPTLQGRRKKIAAVTVRMESSRGLKVGINQPDGSVQSPPQIAPAWSNLTDLPDAGAAPFGSTIKPLFTGDVRVSLTGGYNTKGQIAVQQDFPLPMQVIALIPELLPGDSPETDVKPQQPRQQASA